MTGTTTRPASARAAQSPADRLDEGLRRVDHHKLLMGVFISSESAFFITLIIAYLNYRFNTNGFNGKTVRDALDIEKTGFFSIALFLSSATLALAERGLRNRNRWALRGWLGVTIVLGAIFLVGQGLEYTTLYAENITIHKNLFGTTFFTLTGFHGLHVFIGLLVLTVMLILAFLRVFEDGKNETALVTAGYYWHFVDAVWVFIFSLVYLLAYAG
ncbi:MAG TPA: heme-copper oxidase subunit III [Thermomicrobiales bacterium]|nr:heme-copper oxidase subunit III [Thermomicrobiales bacterium]